MVWPDLRDRASLSKADWSPRKFGCSLTMLAQKFRDKCDKIAEFLSAFDHQESVKIFFSEAFVSNRNPLPATVEPISPRSVGASHWAENFKDLYRPSEALG